MEDLSLFLLILIANLTDFFENINGFLRHFYSCLMLKILWVQSTIQQVIATEVQFSFQECGKNLLFLGALNVDLLRLHKLVLIGLRILNRNAQIVYQCLKVVGKLREVVDSLKSTGFIMKDSDYYIAVYHLSATCSIF